MARIRKLQISERGKAYEVCWSWYDSEGNRKFRKERFRTQAEAKAKKRQVEQAVAEANVPDYGAGRLAFGVWAERWYLSKADKKPTTLRGYRSLLDSSVLPTFKDRQLRAITADEIEAWVHSLVARGLTPPTIKHHHGMVRAVLAFAVERRALPFNPASNTLLPTESTRTKPEPRFLNGNEVETLASYLDAKAPYGLLVRFAAYTGLRAGEISGLNIVDLDLLRRQVIVRHTRYRINREWVTGTPKSGLGRRVPLPRWLVDDLAAYLSTHPHRADPSAPLWPGRSPGGGYTHGKRGSKVTDSTVSGAMSYDAPWDRDVFNRRYFRPALAAVGLGPTHQIPNGVRFHDLRHTYASICASAGHPPYRIAKRMGHASDILTRSIYIHLFAEDADPDMEALTRPTVVTGTVIAGPDGWRGPDEPYICSGLA